MLRVGNAYKNVKPFKTYVLNDSTILSERIKEDYETKRVLNFESVKNEHHELINMKKNVLNDYYFINTFFKVISFNTLKCGLTFLKALPMRNKRPKKVPGKDYG